MGNRKIPTAFTVLTMLHAPLLPITPIPESRIPKSYSWQFSLQLALTQIKSLMLLQFLFPASSCSTAGQQLNVPISVLVSLYLLHSDLTLIQPPTSTPNTQI